MAGGRPTKLTNEVREKVARLARLGLSDRQLIEVFDIAPQTLQNWKKDKKFLESLRAGKEIADERVVNSLYHRACGYEHPEDKIFNNNGTAMVVPTTKHYPPDTDAAKFWLTNRQSDSWRNKQDVGLSGDLSVDVEIFIGPKKVN